LELELELESLVFRGPALCVLAVVSFLLLGLKPGGGWCWLRSLHYAVVALGTPNVTFLVALDTGSDLFWVPCDCIKCAPLVSPTYGVRTAPPSSTWHLLYSLSYVNS